jgi:hypothetical protein
VRPHPYVKTKTKEELITGYDANFSTSFSTKVYFDYLFKKGKLKQVRHFLIPTVAYVYKPDFGQSQYGFYKNVQRDTLGSKQKYSIYEKGIFGGPQLGKQNMLTFNLSNNVEAKYNSKTDTGLVSKKATLIQNASFTGAYNFSADSFKMQNIGFTARTTLFKYLNLNWTSVFDPYDYDKTKKRRVNTLKLASSNQIARFYTAEFACGTSFSKSNFKKKTTSNAATSNAFILDWSLNLNYKLALTNIDATKIKPSHQLSAAYNISPTEFWKLTISTGYDFVNQKVSYTNFDVSRDLKCWEAHITWVPFGASKSYFLTLNLKNAMLREFKIPKRRQFFDNF